MISASDLEPIELFSAMTSEEVEHFAAKAADVHLQASEILVREGERSGFFVVLTGTVGMTKVIHGTEHALTRFSAGDFFGELTNLIGTVSGVSVIAQSPCRIARFELQQLQEMIQSGISSSELILKRMTERVVESQRFAQGVTSARVTLHAAKDGALCQRIRKFLTAHQIPYNWHADSQAEPTKNDQDLGLHVTIDGAARLIDPKLRDIATALGFQTRPKLERYDVVVVGAGPAGMAAGVYGASEGLSVLLVERETAGGQAGASSRIENYLGFPAGISGEDLSQRAVKQATRFGAELMLTRSVEEIIPRTEDFVVTLDEREQVVGRSVLLATGVDWRRLDIAGVDDLLGRGVFYGASRTEALSVKGKLVYLVGGGNSAGQAAMFFSDYAAEVRLLVRGSGLDVSMSQYLIDQLGTKQNIIVEPYVHVTAVGGSNKLESITTTSTMPGCDPCELRRSADSLFIMIGADPNTAWLPPSLQRDEKGFLLTGRDLPSTPGDGRVPFPLETNLPGLFCAGDVRHGSIKRVASGVGEGSMAISFIYQYLRNLRSVMQFSGGREGQG